MRACCQGHDGRASPPLVSRYSTDTRRRLKIAPVATTHMCLLFPLRLVGQAPLARTMVAFAALPSFAVLLLWVTCQPALTMTAAAASPSLYNMPPFPFAGLGELQDVVRKAIGILRDAAADVVPASLPVDASRTHATDGSELGDAEEDSLAMFRRPAHSSDESGGEDEDQSEDESHGGGSSSGSDTVAADSGDEETRGPEESAVDGLVTAAGESDSLLEKLREWLDVDGPRTPIQEDHLLRPLHWLPKQGHRLLAASRKRVGQCADAADARAVLWTWRALAAAADSATQEWLAASNAPATSKPGGVFVTPVESTRAVEATEEVGLGAAPEAEAASASEETEFAEDDAALPTTDEVSELRRERERLNRALEHRQRRGQGGAQEQGDLALSEASLELPTVVIPAILVPDTNVFLNARHWVVLKGIIVGEWMQAGGGNPELAVAVPLIGERILHSGLFPLSFETWGVAFFRPEQCMLIKSLTFKNMYPARSFERVTGHCAGRRGPGGGRHSAGKRRPASIRDRGGFEFWAALVVCRGFFTPSGDRLTSDTAAMLFHASMPMHTRNQFAFPLPHCLAPS